MRNLLFLFLIFFCVNISYANNQEEVHLQNYNVKTLSVPKASYEKIYSLNPEEEEDSYYFEQDEDVFENKAGKAFSKFVDNKVINNKINNFANKISN